MIVNIHDGLWQCTADSCGRVFTRRPERCDHCGTTSLVKITNMSIAWGDDVTAIAEGMVAIAGKKPGTISEMSKGMEDLVGYANALTKQNAAQAKPNPCQPDPFPMQQSAALSAILDSWPLHPTGGRLEDHIREVLCNVEHLTGAATRIAQQLERHRKTVER